MSSYVLWEESPKMPPLAVKLFAGLFILPVFLTLGLTIFIFVEFGGMDENIPQRMLLFPAGMVVFLTAFLFFMIWWTRWLNRNTIFKIFSDGKILCKTPLSEVSYQLRSTTRYSVTKSLLGNSINFDFEARFRLFQIEDPEKVSGILDELIKSAK
ncbi:hypothetical protein GW916_06855 [bacterium]|nr:hypothetical protein [bacterium]